MAKLKTTAATTSEDTTTTQAATTFASNISVAGEGAEEQPAATSEKEVTAPEPNIEPTLILNLKNKSVSETAGSFNVNITSNSDWTTSNVPSWITLTPAGGREDKAVKVAYTANSAYSQRSKSITFSVGELTQTLYVTQSAAIEPTPQPGPEPEGNDPDEFEDQILKCFPKEELLYIDRQGGIYVQNTKEHIRGKAVLYTNPYFNKA